jgi:kinesin family protein 4/21/27
MNTLKYANRARNIKNRAQLNAQEVGWEDVEYLQSTIIKLRKELAHLKSSTSPADVNSSRMLSSINEEDSVQDELSPKYLNLKGNFTELQAKYAKTLSDLAQAQNNLHIASRNSGQSPSISQSAFDEMIQPIVEEYEKSITALESQLALTKAALVHSEHSMRELESQLLAEQALNENQANYVADLKARLNRLSERESENESYIKDLELKLKALSESEESSTGTVVELKKELAKIKEHDAESEAYIKDLEAKLSNHDSADLNEQIAALEASIASRDERCDALQAKYDLLYSQLSGTNVDLWHQQQHLTEQLSERESKVQQLEGTHITFFFFSLNWAYLYMTILLNEALMSRNSISRACTTQK